MAEANNTQQELIDDNSIIFTERKRILFFGLPWTFTKYTISPGVITINRGFLNTTEDSCYMYKVQDVKLSTTFAERLFGLSTIICYTGDVTDPELRLIHIRHAKDIKSYLLKTSEEARMKRRTLNTMDIGAHGLDLDGDGIPDSMQ
jgi:uncharacterized membrane protein YdbT with pleckstrin-like domain